MANFGVNSVGKINRGCSRRKPDDFAFRGEYVNLFGADFKSQSIKELPWVLSLRLPIRKVLKPDHVIFCGGLRCASLLLVLPMGSNTEFRTIVHFGCSNLNLNRTTCRPNHCGVERLIQIELRHCNVIFESARYRIPMGMNGTQNRITISNSWN